MKSNNATRDNGSIKDKDIVSTLSLGDNFSTFKFVLTWSMIVICIIGFVLMVITSYTENNMDDLYASFIPIALLVVPISFLCFGYNRRKKIKKWLEDAVLLDAKCERVFDNNLEKVLVTFTHEGKLFSKMSKFRYYKPITSMAIGYSDAYEKLFGHDIKVLYSPKYDEVMIPKQ